jgi:hypothetical protein
MESHQKGRYNKIHFFMSGRSNLGCSREKYPLKNEGFWLYLLMLEFLRKSFR